MRIGDGAERLARVAYQHPDAQRLVRAVQAEYVQRYGGPDESPIVDEVFAPPTGSFFVLYLDETPVATGAWRVREMPAVEAAMVAEIKRMYVAPPARGRGLARRMLTHLEETAREAGVEALVLETGIRQPEAIALYESAGYRPIDGFGHYRDSPLSRCFGKAIAAGAGPVQFPRPTGETGARQGAQHLTSTGFD